ncbi:MAG: CD0415/CD1112 family protein [Lachnospiraceae bacterium]|nr:CD0415/CD1112 family protein [Lachnospiraceae bacterium]
MFGILNTLEQWLKDLLISFITSNLTTLFDDVNTKVDTIASEVSRTPATWNASIFPMIRNLSDNVIVPIAGIIITFVLCYELITMITEKNNMHDVDTFMFFKYFFKAAVAVYLVSNTFTITTAVFDVPQHIFNNACGIISRNTNTDIATTIVTMQTDMQTMEIGGLLQLAVKTMVVIFCLKIVPILITVIPYGRMNKIYITIPVFSI